MRTTRLAHSSLDILPDWVRDAFYRRLREAIGLFFLLFSIVIGLAFATWSIDDPSLSNASSSIKMHNLLGYPGAIISDIGIQLFGIGTIALVFCLALLGVRILKSQEIKKIYLFLPLVGTVTAASFASSLPNPNSWPLPTGLGGAIGDLFLGLSTFISLGSIGFGRTFSCFIFAILTIMFIYLLGKDVKNKEAVNSDYLEEEEQEQSSKTIISIGAFLHILYAIKGALSRILVGKSSRKSSFNSIKTDNKVYQEDNVEENIVHKLHKREPFFENLSSENISRSENLLKKDHDVSSKEFSPKFSDIAKKNKDDDEISTELSLNTRVIPTAEITKSGKKGQREIFLTGEYQFPSLKLLAEPSKNSLPQVSTDALEQNARILEEVLEDFGVKGEIIKVRPGPVVTLYELEPAPGTKSSRVVGLAEDVARSMSAVAARIAVVAGRNAIGIELPNEKRATVLLRELLASEEFEKSKLRLPICLGKTIGGEPVIVDLAKMPHLLVAGTTGSGKSVAINTMICSLLYCLKPEECRLIMIDPKMLELSIYDGIPHLLCPVVTDPKKAVISLKWAVREMENRYRKMSKVGVRNIDGYNARMDEAKARNETITRTIQSGFDRKTGEPLYEDETIQPEKIPYIVVIVDEMADLMLVAGKEIEGAVQRLAQMARAAGIHIIMATQRPSVDVITGTIKANFPTRISFQVTSKIDSRTILGEMGAEQLLGQGDMLYMAGGGRISRVHGPFVADGEVEKIVSHLKTQGKPDYVDSVTTEVEDEKSEKGDSAVFDKGEFGDEGADLYDQAVAIVLRDKKASTSYVQRRLQIGYNRAASLIERMEKEGVVSAPNHAGKREILLKSHNNNVEEDDD